MALEPGEVGRSSPVDSIGVLITMEGFVPVALLAQAGFDFVVVDMQHEPFTMRDVAELAAATSVQNAMCLVRTPVGSATAIEAVLDAGADGVVVPMVRTSAEAERAIAACRYPPRGTRSIGGVRHRLLRGRGSHISHPALCVLQLEDVAGAAAVEQILEIDGVDAIFPGPADLAVSLGLDPTSALDDPPPEVRAELEKIADACLRRGVAQMAITESERGLAAARARGASFIITATDAGLLRSAAQARVRSARAISQGTAIEPEVKSNDRE